LFKSGIVAWSYPTLSQFLWIRIIFQYILNKHTSLSQIWFLLFMSVFTQPLLINFTWRTIRIDWPRICQHRLQYHKHIRLCAHIVLFKNDKDYLFTTSHFNKLCVALEKKNCKHLHHEKLSALYFHQMKRIQGTSFPFPHVTRVTSFHLVSLSFPIPVAKLTFWLGSHLYKQTPEYLWKCNHQRGWSGMPRFQYSPVCKLCRNRPQQSKDGRCRH